MIYSQRFSGKRYAQAMQILHTLNDGETCVLSMPKEDPNTLKAYLKVFEENKVRMQVKGATKKEGNTKVFTGYIISKI